MSKPIIVDIQSVENLIKDCKERMKAINTKGYKEIGMRNEIIEKMENLESEFKSIDDYTQSIIEIMESEDPIENRERIAEELEKFPEDLPLDLQEYKDRFKELNNDFEDNLTEILKLNGEHTQILTNYKELLTQLTDLSEKITISNIKKPIIDRIVTLQNQIKKLSDAVYKAKTKLEKELEPDLDRVFQHDFPELFEKPENCESLEALINVLFEIEDQLEAIEEKAATFIGTHAKLFIKINGSDLETFSIQELIDNDITETPDDDESSLKQKLRTLVDNGLLTEYFEK